MSNFSFFSLPLSNNAVATSKRCVKHLALIFFLKFVLVFNLAMVIFARYTSWLVCFQ